MKKFLLAILILTSTTMADAVTTMHLQLKDGSVLSGYIQKQDDKGMLTFQSESAVICLSESAGVAITGERTVNVTELGKAWCKWADEHTEFVQTNGGTRQLLVADVTAKGHTARQVVILERGVLTRYQEMTPQTYTIPIADVVRICGELREPLMLSGINRIYQLKSGQQYEGQYAEENDSTLTLLLGTGVRQSLFINDVVKYTYRPINANQTIFEQSALLDVLKTRQGGELKGIVIEQNYMGKTDADNYYLIQQQSGAIQSVKVSDVTETCKEENPQYAPKYDIVLKEGEILVNRQAAKIVNANKQNGYVTLDSIGNDMTIDHASSAKTLVSVEYREGATMKFGTFAVVKVQRQEDKKGVTTYYFTIDDITTFQPSKTPETSVNKTVKLEYEVEGTGVFALYDKEKGKAIPFIIK